jgi:hypothetical protein
LHLPAESFNKNRVRSKSLTVFATAFLWSSTARAEFVGAQSCSTSGCHGGAKRNESITWSKKDFHSRAYATLTTARSARIAETLHIADPAHDSRCIICHAPMPEAQRADGVSCETCHGAAENWLRTHTRSDYTHADRLQAGMRELKNLTARANACVACHQNIDADILAAGHPELIFELDGQSVAMPKHWHEPSSPQAWFAGQTVALREMKWQLSREPNDKLAARVAGLDWLLQKCGDSPDLARLAATSGDFEDASVSREVQARRAGRLVLALDRLSSSKADVDELFKLAQSLPDFDPKKFAEALQRFASKLNNSSASP